MNLKPGLMQLLYRSLLILFFAFMPVSCAAHETPAGTTPMPVTSSTNTPFLPIADSAAATPAATQTERPSPTGIEPAAASNLAAAAADPTAAATKPNIAAAEPNAAKSPAASASPEVPVKLTVLYDNIPYDPRVRTGWGFACLVETSQGNLLFDTGGNGSILMENIAALGLEQVQIDAIAISHQHGDHINGLSAAASAYPDALVFLPPAFSEGIKAAYRSQERLAEVSGWTEVFPGVFLTGEIGGDVVEQALAVETQRGLVVVTGCAHPGISEIVRQARDHGEVYLVMGGFHLSSLTQGQIQGIIESFREMAVQKAAPSHCTGTLAIQMFMDAYGADFIKSGAGAVILP